MISGPDNRAFTGKTNDCDMNSILRAALTLAVSGMMLPCAPTLDAAVSADGISGDMKKAATLYEKGMFNQARTIFDAVADKTGSSEAIGRSILCCANLKTPGYEKMIASFAETYPYSGLLPQIRYRFALNLFDEGRWKAAAEQLELFDADRLDKNDRAEYLYKKAYSYYELQEYDAAMYGFGKVELLSRNSYTAPSQYATGYILYQKQDFKGALSYFEKSSSDPRFADISNYYITECRFMMKDYKYVTDRADKLYASVPEDRKPHLARIISESYLVQGDASKAKAYYETIKHESAKNRDYLFYAGSLLYALEDYQGAIDNYSRMTDRSDSLGQIADYQLGFSYIQVKNKVAALDCFKHASSLVYDTKIQEDAYYNYAKLAFDLNDDGSVFKDYMEKYKETAKNDRIYSYMALAALYDHDYAGAVEAYDQIDELDEDMRSNYMKANYLRANQLISNGAYRDAEHCLKAAAYYADKYSTFNQLARYWLAESYYRDGKYGDSRKLYTELYNISALDRKDEGNLIPYNIAYSYFGEGNNAMATKWFDEYLSSPSAKLRKDALVRKADCLFIDKNYKDAAEAYSAIYAEYKDPNDVYSYYQAGISYGLVDNLSKKIAVLSPVRKASVDAPYFSDALYELGRSLVADGQDDNAIECYKTLIASAKDSSFVAKGLLGLGMVERNRSQYHMALDYYKKVVSEMPGTEYAEDALLAIESIYQTKQEPEEYLAYIESLGTAGNKTEADKEAILFNSAEQIFLAENYRKALVSLESYEQKYPEGVNLPKACFYIAECYKALDDKEKACDYYKKVIDRDEGSFAEISALSFARLSYGMERYGEAYSGYKKLGEIARIDNNKFASLLGMMRSAFRAKEYDIAISCSDKVKSDIHTTADYNREADYIKAKSLLATSNRDAAFAILGKLSSLTNTPEGAEASYLLIQDSYDQGKFADVEKQVFAFSDKGSSQKYWMAKSFILLGDSYAEQNDYLQAKATFESIRDGYAPAEGTTDEILDNVTMRLKRLSDLMSE